MARKKKRARPVPLVEIIETLQPAPADLDMSAKWYLVWTTPRGEARAAKGLADAGCRVFWPHFERVTRRRNKPEIKNMVATYPRYLFASGLPSLARRLTVVGADGRSGVTIDGRPIDDIRQIDGVVAVISSERGWCQVPAKAIARVAEHQGDIPRPVPARVAPMQKPLTAGDTVTIIEGPFASFQATVIETMGLDAAKVLIDVFGRPTSAEMDLAQIAAA